VVTSATREIAATTPRNRNVGRFCGDCEGRDELGAGTELKRLALSDSTGATEPRAVSEAVDGEAVDGVDGVDGTEAADGADTGKGAPESTDAPDAGETAATDRAEGKDSSDVAASMAAGAGTGSVGSLLMIAGRFLR
jgi:hypothetical protein